jgi:hypothetical protein
MNKQATEFQIIRLVDLEVGDRIGTDWEESTTDWYTEEIQEAGELQDFQTVKSIKVEEVDRHEHHTITYENGTVDILVERPGCYCGCRDYYVTVIVVPEGTGEINR